MRRILWPIVVWTIVYAGAEYLADPAQAKYMPWELGFWNTYLWFMQFVFAYYILAAADQRIPIWVLIVVPFVVRVLHTPGDAGSAAAFLLLMPFFFLGAFIEKYWDRYARILSVPLAWALAIIPVGVAVYSGLDDIWAREAGVEGGGGIWYDPWFAAAGDARHPHPRAAWRRRSPTVRGCVRSSSSAATR